MTEMQKATSGSNRPCKMATADERLISQKHDDLQFINYIEKSSNPTENCVDEKFEFE